MAEIDRCVHCGEYVPEGRMICYNCEYTALNLEDVKMENMNWKHGTNIFTIYSQRLAGFLMQRGCSLIAMVRNKENCYNNFLFVNTPELHVAIEEWQKLKK